MGVPYAPSLVAFLPEDVGKVLSGGGARRGRSCGGHRHGEEAYGATAPPSDCAGVCHPVEELLVLLRPIPTFKCRYQSRSVRYYCKYVGDVVSSHLHILMNAHNTSFI
ncbi:uncharacterized protein [Aegilops tauschii subsp. strangulata]|uniref:uncharacterized protein isoform X1 n=1 Tax=Aegilops tauschii subsp. strangulata TaxID=200361 RepID=UPI00098A8C45|nr:uncharacterized protein LOC109748023 isoform X1 [Aegilops tauschii subsp. strangulata]